MTPLLPRIRASLDSLTTSEHRVASLCLADPSLFARLAVGDIAEMAHVSKPTVVRFGRSVGYEGIADFRKKLAGSLNEGIPFIHQSADQRDSVDRLTVKLVDGTIACLRSFRDTSSTNAIEIASMHLAEAFRSQRKIQIYGLGSSGLTAQDLQLKLMRLGANVISLTDSHLQVTGASLLSNGDCVVLISNSGKSRDLIDSCELARRKGATTLTITSSGSPLASEGDIHIAADHDEGYDIYSPMNSRILHLMIIDILVTQFALKIGGAHFKDSLLDMQKNMRGKRFS
jgi:RpiR family carbohydrate utilization transcriptional regulator